MGRFYGVHVLAGCLLGILLSNAPAFAYATAGDSIPAARSTGPIPLDPTLSSQQWQHALVATDFFDVTTRKIAPLQTTAYLLYGKDALYVGFRCAQDGVPIRSTQTTNNIGLGQDDFVMVGIDTSGNSSQVYFFSTTPRGVRYQRSTESSRYNPDWQAVATVQGTTWSAMMVIPFKDLRAKSGGVQTWRMTFVRGISQTGDHFAWAFNPLIQDGPPTEWPYAGQSQFWPSITGLDVPKAASRPPAHAEIYGLASTGQDHNVFQDTDGTFHTRAARIAGVDFTYPLTNTMALVGAVNPDFSNVEVDQQTIVPQEFQRNLTEFRPFFAQGANFVDPVPAPPNFISGANSIFYTPSIGAFDRGLKVEGAFGLQSLGVLNVAGHTSDGAMFHDTAFGLLHATGRQTFQWWTDGVFAQHGSARDDTLEGGLSQFNPRSGLSWSYDDAEEHGSAAHAAQAYTHFGQVDLQKANYEANVAWEILGLRIARWTALLCSMTFADPSLSQTSTARDEGTVASKRSMGS